MDETEEKQPDAGQAGQEEGQEESEGFKMTWTVGGLILLTAIVFDVIDLIPLAGDVEAPFGVVGTFLSYMFKMHPAVTFVTGTVTILEAIPVVQEFPLWTIGAVIVILIEALAPRALKEKFEQVASLAAAGQGGAAAELKEGEYVAGEIGGKTIVAQTGLSNEEFAALQSQPGTLGSTVEGSAAGEAGSSELADKARRNAEIEKEMASGAEIPPQEQMESEDFSPEDIQFREARGPAPAEDYEEEDEEEDEESMPMAA